MRSACTGSNPALRLMEQFMDKRKIGLIAGGAFVILLAVIFGMKLRYEWKVQGAIEDALAALPQPLVVKAGDIDVSFFNKSVTLTNVKGSYTLTVPQAASPDGADQSIPMEYTMASVAATGVNIDGFKEGAGVAKLLDSLTITGVAFTSPLAQATIDRYYLEGISADFARLAGEIRNAFPALMEANAIASYQQSREQTQELMHGIASILKAYETMQVKKLSLKNYAYSMNAEDAKVDMLMGSMEARDYSIRQMGPFSLNDVKMSLNGTPFMEMKAVTTDGMVLPSFVALVEELAKSPFPSQSVLQETLKGQNFALKNLRFKDITLRHPMQKDLTVFSLADSTFSYVAKDAHVMDFAFSNLNIAKSVIEQQAGIPASVLATQPEIISFEGAIQQQTKMKEPGSYDVAVKRAHIKGTGLGEASLALAANNINSMAIMMGAPGGAELEKFEISLTDKGLSDVIFALDGMHSGSNAAEQREQELADLREQLEEETSVAGKQILTGIIAFLEKTGATLSVVIAPPTPTGLDQLSEAFEAGSPDLGLSVTVTPAAATGN